MEYIKVVLDFISSNPIVALIAGVIVVRKMVNDQQHMFNDVHEVRKKYINRTLAHMEEVLETVISKSYNRMIVKISKITSKCPSGNSGCSFPSNDMHQQMLLYKMLLRDTFLIRIKNKVKSAIFKNGYHHYSVLELNKYYERKGLKLYYDVLDTLKESLELSAPDVYSLIGSNFSEEEAIAMFRDIIEKCLSDEANRDEDIAVISKKYSIVSKIKRINNEYIAK